MGGLKAAFFIIPEFKTLPSLKPGILDKQGKKIIRCNI